MKHEITKYTPYAGGVPAAFGVAKSPGGGGVRQRRTSLGHVWLSGAVCGVVPRCVLLFIRARCFYADLTVALSALVMRKNLFVF